jgi:ribonuclease E
MSNNENPAENTGGDNATPSALGDLPAKLRIHALAKLLTRSSKEVLAAVTELGGTAKSAQSSVDRELALRVGERLAAPAQGGDGTPAKTSEPKTAEPKKSEGKIAEAKKPEPKTAAPRSAEPKTSDAAEAPKQADARDKPETVRAAPPVPQFTAASPLFLQPEPTKAPVKEKPKPDNADAKPAADKDETADSAVDAESADRSADGDDFDDDDPNGRRRRRRGRRGRGRGKGGQDQDNDTEDDNSDAADAEPVAGVQKDRKAVAKGKGGGKSKDNAQKNGADQSDADAKNDNNNGPKGDGQLEDDEDGPGGSRRRRRRRRRKGVDGDNSDGTDNDPPNTVVHVRDGRSARQERADAGDEVRAVRGSTRLEAKRQRRRDGREAGRRRAPILSEAEFLARREAVERRMVVREEHEHTQIGVLEDGVLVEHFVTSNGSGSLVGNVYLGRVQNVLPSMEAAFVDIGRGRNAVLYAGEVDWDAAGLEGKARKIEQALSTGDSVLVQVTKDPVGHKGARLTTQVSLPGRFLVYVPGGTATGISRKLPDNERKRLKDILKRIVPEDAGVIIRTASEGISEDDLARDVNRLQGQWELIKERSGAKSAKAPELVYEEPDLLVKVVRDLFTEDFVELVVSGGSAWDTINGYVEQVAPEMTPRLKRHVGNVDVFTEFRIDEQITKALDRKVWLPSGGYLVIDRTEAMTVIDVNTGKFTGSGGNLEETVTRNNLESAEEIVRQLRLRDIGGIIVIDFIDMVLESNRDLVLRRLTECLGRDRTRHQVAEVTSLGLVQMTRKRVGTGLLEAFSTPCEHCKGRGVNVSTSPVEAAGGSVPAATQSSGSSRKNRGRNNKSESKPETTNGQQQQDAEEAKRAAQRVAAAALLHAKAEAAAKKDDEPAEQPVEAVTAPAAPAPAPAPAEVLAPATPAPVVTQESVPARPAAAEVDKAPARRPAGAPTPTSAPVSNGHEPTATGTASVVTGAPPARKRRRAVSRPAGSSVGE